MKHVISALMAGLLATTASGAPTSLEFDLTVAATPLQAYHAFVVDWQIKQWSGAEAVLVDVTPGGIWRATFADRHVEDGKFVTTEPTTKLVFTLFADTIATDVEVSFLDHGDSTSIQIRHGGFGDDANAESRARLWENRWKARLPILRDYLNNIPGGYLAIPAGKDLPPVVLLHDRFGLNRTIRAFADSLAAAGYATLAVDMFKGDVTADLTQAARFLSLVRVEESMATVRRSMSYLRGRMDVDGKKLVLWGVGYGGSVALQLAATASELRACVTWSPTLPDVEITRGIHCPVLAIFGDPDVSNPAPYVVNSDRVLRQSGAEIETVVLPAAREFFDPAYAQSYDRAATRDAWRKTIAYLDRQ